MDEDRVKGAAKDVGGKVQDAVGGLVGDASTQLRGKANQVAGQAQEVYGQAQEVYGQTLDNVRDFAAEKPVAALLSAMAAGVVLGFVLGRR